MGVDGRSRHPALPPRAFDVSWLAVYCHSIWRSCVVAALLKFASEIRLSSGDFLKIMWLVGDIRLKGHGRGVTKGTLESRLPARHYAICIYCRTLIFWTLLTCYTHGLVTWWSWGKWALFAYYWIQKKEAAPGYHNWCLKKKKLCITIMSTTGQNHN